MLPELESLLRRAGDLARSARPEMQRSEKPDGSIVTTVDHQVETLFREELPRLVPAAIWGEEFGHQSPNEHGQWLIDPIDGTTNFAWGLPTWGISVGLYRRGEITLGGLYLPDLGEMLLGQKGHGVTLNGQALTPITPGPVLKSQPVSYCEAISRSGVSLPGRQRCSGAFVVDGAFVVSGRMRGLIGIREHLYDVAPCILFAQELGMEVRYADGQALDLGALTEPETFGRPWLLFPSNSGFTWPNAA